jgi:glycosyltransferase involved in cell wall biosynthesis
MSKNQKTALIYSPYLDTWGGGEVYTLNFARCLSGQNFKIDLAWPDLDFNKVLTNRFHYPLELNIIPKAYEVLNHGSLWQKYQLTKSYEVIFFVSDGSIPFLFAKKNFLHFQVPFTNLKANFPTKLKLRNLQVICNSQFTKNIIDQRLNIKSQVVYPPINVKPTLAQLPKEHTILSVGRFTKAMHNKRQDVLIEAFKKLYKSGYKNWQLVLAGSSTEGKELLAECRHQAQGYPIKFMVDIDYQTLQTLYQQATFFWHATGYEINENIHPEQVEHFGISTTEAMAAGCVPIVINKGGQKEIVESGINGYLFNNIDELAEITAKLINQPEQINSLRLSAIQKAKKFTYQEFCKMVSLLL